MDFMPVESSAFVLLLLLLQAIKAMTGNSVKAETRPDNVFFMIVFKGTLIFMPPGIAKGRMLSAGFLLFSTAA
jgi:hypothetical protein